MLYVVIAFVLNNQNLNAQATEPPEFLPESPIYLDGRIINNIQLNIGENVITDLPKSFLLLMGKK